MSNTPTTAEQCTRCQQIVAPHAMVCDDDNGGVYHHPACPPARASAQAGAGAGSRPASADPPTEAERARAHATLARLPAAADRTERQRNDATILESVVNGSADMQDRVAAQMIAQERCVTTTTFPTAQDEQYAAELDRVWPLAGAR